MNYGSSCTHISIIQVMTWPELVATSPLTRGTKLERHLGPCWQNRRFGGVTVAGVASCSSNLLLRPIIDSWKQKWVDSANLRIAGEIWIHSTEMWFWSPTLKMAQLCEYLELEAEIETIWRQLTDASVKATIPRTTIHVYAFKTSPEVNWLWKCMSLYLGPRGFGGGKLRGTMPKSSREGEGHQISFVCASLT